MKKKVGIFGHFGFGKTKLNGQTVKTLAVAHVTEQTFGKENVLIKDTAGGMLALPRMIKDAFVLQKQCAQKVVLLAQNGLSVLIPVLYALNGFSGKNMHFVTIGGWLPEFLCKRKILAKMLKQFSGVYAETEEMVKKLHAMEFKNVYLLTNFKPFESKVAEIKQTVSEPVMLCTFSRVIAQKGIQEAILATEYANKNGTKKYKLTVFGTIDAKYTQVFEKMQKHYANIISYGGEVPYDKSVSVLKEYDALLFPTYYEGEGFAGTLIDAFYAGLAVVATDFKANKDYVEHGENGILVPPQNAEALGNAIINLFEKNDVFTFRRESLKLADKYKTEAADVLLRNLN